MKSSKRELNAKRFAAKPLRQPTYDFKQVPQCSRNLEGSTISEVTDRNHFFDSMAEMVLLCKEAVRRNSSSHGVVQKKSAAKPLSLEYMADRIDVDDPTFGYLVRKDEMLQGFITVTTFTNWQKTFRWDSMHDSAFSYDEPCLAEQMARQERRYDQNGTLAEALQSTVRCGDPWNEGIVWPRIAEISLLGGLGCGKTLLSLVIEKLERMNATGSRNYDYVVLQATDNSVPFYESMGFVRVGCITEDLDFEKKRNRAMLDDEEEKKDEDATATAPPPPPAEVVSSAVVSYITKKQGEVPADVAKRFHCDVWDIIFLNQYVYPGIVPRSRLIRGTSLFVPSEQAKRDASSHASPQPSSNDDDNEGSAPKWYVAKENDTPRTIASMFQVNYKDVVLGNRERLPELQAYSRLKEGTRVKVSHFHIHDDVHVPYCHWTFPDDTLDTSEPSYMMALKLDRKRGSKAKNYRPVENSLAVPIQTKYEPPAAREAAASLASSTPTAAKATTTVAALDSTAVKEPVRPKRPLSSYMIFCGKQRHRFKDSGLRASEILKILSQEWQEVNERDKAKYHALHEKERAAYQVAKAAYEEALAEYRKAHPDLTASKTEGGNGLFNKVVKLCNYNHASSTELFDYYYVLTYIPDLQWCHLAPLHRVGVWGPDKPRAEGRPIWMLVDESQGKELDVSAGFCQVVKARSMKRTVDADQEQWDILETRSSDGATYHQVAPAANVLAQLSNPSPVKRGRGRPRKIISQESGTVPPIVKRGRGRPRKVVAEDGATPPIVKRGRGRPRKVIAEGSDSASIPTKRKRGRPPKVTTESAVSTLVNGVALPVGKRPRGRPRKNIPRALAKLVPPTKKKWRSMNHVEHSPPPKRKRGRPPKMVEEATSPPTKRRRLPVEETVAAAEVVSTPLRNGTKTAVGDTSLGNGNPLTEMEQEQPRRRQGPFAVGDVVEVQSRTWPGINKLGGIGRVTKVHRVDNGTVVYDVSYVLGGRERKVDAAFVMGDLEPMEKALTNGSKATRTSPRGKKFRSPVQPKEGGTLQRETRRNENTDQQPILATIGCRDRSDHPVREVSPDQNAEETTNTVKKLAPIFFKKSTRSQGTAKSNDVNEEAENTTTKAEGKRSTPARSAAPLFGQSKEMSRNLPLLGRGVRRATRASA